jgi:hypothetical protein
MSYDDNPSLYSYLQIPSNWNGQELKGNVCYDVDLEKQMKV